MLPTISRRAFLQGLGLCSAGLAVGGLATPVQAADIVRNPFDESRLLMDTIVRITVARASRDRAEQGMGLAFAEMERLIALFDHHHGGTAISVLNSQGSLADAPAEFLTLLEASHEHHRLTSQAFDITVQPVLGLLTRHSNPRGDVHVDKADMQAALALVGMDNIRVAGNRISLAKSGMELTLDGIAKGYIVDQAASVLESQGLKHYVINAGGDIRVSGEKRPGQAWTVAVEDPAKKHAYPALLSMRGGAVATSGVYERYFDKAREHSHLIKPATGESPVDRLSVTVKAPTALRADALATALSIMPMSEALRLANSLPDSACLFVTREGKVVMSDNWKA